MKFWGAADCPFDLTTLFDMMLYAPCAQNYYFSIPRVEIRSMFLERGASHCERKNKCSFGGRARTLEQHPTKWSTTSRARTLHQQGANGARNAASARHRQRISLLCAQLWEQGAWRSKAEKKKPMQKKYNGRPDAAMRRVHSTDSVAARIRTSLCTSTKDQETDTH